ncbi:MAG: DUF1592 domain-containing protein [Myxococcota bacterium]
MAERLALTLWHSVPDETLMEAARSGELETDEGILAQVERMLADPDKGDRFLAGFINRNFSLPSAEAVPPGLENLPDAELLSEDLRMESTLYLAKIFESDVGASALVTNTTTHLNGRLSEFYGFGNVSGDEFVEVSTEGTGRTGGLLTMGGTLARQGDLVHRGVAILNTLFCQPFEAPDADLVDAALRTLPENPTIREEIALRAENSACVGCHALIDPLGAPFEIFDEAGLPQTEYANGESVHHGLSFQNTPLDTPDDVTSTITQTEYLACLSKHVLETVGSRRLDLQGNEAVRCATEELLADLEPEPGLRSIVARAFLSNMFQARVVE